MIVCGYRGVAFAGEIVGVEWSGELGRRVAELAFADLSTSDDRLPSVTLRVGAHVDSPLLTLSAGSRCLYRGVSIGACAHLLVQTALESLISRSDSGLVVHAALVGHGDAGVLLPGATGSGKTMLCAWLMRRGMTYFSDEACYVAAGMSSADGFARPLCFKGAWAEPLGVAPTDTIGERRGHGVSLVPSRELKGVCGHGSVVPRLAVFPSFHPGASLAMTRLSKGRAAVRLLETVANSRNLPDHGVDQVTDLARTIPAYHLTYGSFDQLDPLRTLLESIA